MRSAGLGGVWLMIGIAGRVAAQGADNCFPGPASNEARTMAKFAVPLAFSAAGAPLRERTGSIRLGFDLSYVPKVDPAVATPTICRPDKPGPENTDLLFAAPRPRVSVSLPAGFIVEASWIPPIRMSEVRANLVGVALSRVTPIGARAVLELRAHTTFGVVKAPITCDDNALKDANSPCYQGTRSDDAFKPTIFGGSAAVGWTVRNTVHAYLGAGYNHLRPRFQVNFTNRFGAVDRRRVIVDLDRGVLFGGATWSPGGRLDLSAEVYSAPVDAVTVRVAGRVRLK